LHDRHERHRHDPIRQLGTLYTERSRGFRQVGLDLGDVECPNDIEQEVSRWADTLADERFELLAKIASAMAKAKGVKLPPRLNVVPSAESPQ
jgi:hypothetical protein